MSSKFLRATRLAVVLGAGTVLAGCQDAVAPISDSSLYEVEPTPMVARSASGHVKLIDNQYIVVLRPGSEVERSAKSLLAKTHGRLKHTYKSGLRGFSASMSPSEAAIIARAPNVAYVEQDQEITLGVGKPSGDGTGGGKGGKGKTTAEVGTSTQTSPPSWGLDRIDQNLLPLNNSYTYSATGSNVHAYIIDSGIRTTHTEFGGRATAAFTVVNDGNGASDCNWHGTHVAGIVGGKTAGVAKGVFLHAVRVLDCYGSGSVSGLIAGLDWVALNRVTPAVANVSVLTAYSAALNEAVDLLVASGVTVVVAAGNNADDACNYSPATASSVLSVGATTSIDTKASFSNTGSCVDLMAPGQDIFSSFYSSDVGLMAASGTSMASPHVAGAAALYLQQNPAAPPSAVINAILNGSTSSTLLVDGTGTTSRLLRIL